MTLPSASLSTWSIYVASQFKISPLSSIPSTVLFVRPTDCLSLTVEYSRNTIGISLTGTSVREASRRILRLLDLQVRITCTGGAILPTPDVDEFPTSTNTHRWKQSENLVKTHQCQRARSLPTSYGRQEHVESPFPAGISTKLEGISKLSYVLTVWFVIDDSTFDICDPRLTMCLSVTDQHLHLAPCYEVIN